MSIRLGVLASGTGTNLQAIIDASEQGRIDAAVVVVISDRRDALALRRAEAHGIKAAWVNPREYETRDAHDARVVEILKSHDVDLVVLAGYMRLITRTFIDAFPRRIMNIHPALLPSFPGKDGLTPALDYGVKVSGCTVHFVDAGTDSGPIIAQAAVPVLEGDTPETLARRIHAEEHRIYPEAIQLFAQGRLRIVNDRRVEILPEGQSRTARTAATADAGSGLTPDAPLRARRALLSVHDKTGLVEFARGLVGLGFELVSSGGTARTIAEAGVPVTPVDDVTGFPEMLDGRVKTLHPAVHGGILARRDRRGHLQEIARHGIVPIDLVAVNLYPFQATVNRQTERGEDLGEDTREDAFAEAVENIDIGGPSMVRSAAKNHAAVVIVTDPSQYEMVLGHLKTSGNVPPEVRRELALIAFRRTAYYDATIAAYLEGVVERDRAGVARRGQAPAPPVAAGSFPDRLVLPFEKAYDLRYGENPHQKAAFYRHPLRRALLDLGATLPEATQLQGKELSYNNIADAEAALRAAEELDEGPDGPAAAVAVKHMNPCGAAVARDILTAYRLTFESDPVSIFGGIVALTRPVDAGLAAELVRTFLEVVLAPGFTPEALEVLKAKPNIRLLALPVGAARRAVAAGAAGSAGAGGLFEAKTVAGGLLVQTPDLIEVTPSQWKPVTKRRPTKAELRDLSFAWKVCKHVKSNAITVAKAGQLIGVGAGQMNRVDSVRLAVGHAGEKARGAVMASDAFFPFPDSIEVADRAGITAIVQPGGSLKDEEAIRACEAAGMAMVFTGERHFRH
ncbi:MAG: bifunctional phosphoribosylaminoimidazolecarboxamide formyltransferase/IMP cyclohydrolase PurH [Bacillota bacterium]|nr:MAG: bifunctional phosphoribosylaminoimidazolecarboxamide formyltransferase/IMP cyclohydrolase PurH [Bacillota bacterium]